MTHLGSTRGFGVLVFDEAGLVEGGDVTWHAQILSPSMLGPCGQSCRRWRAALNSGGGEKRDDERCLNLNVTLNPRSQFGSAQCCVENQCYLICNVEGLR